MNNPENLYRVAIGGGPDWLHGHGHGVRVMESINNLRMTKLAKENPTINYVVLDMYIPRSEAYLFHKGYPNLHFVEHKIAEPLHLPFKDSSIDRVEINHMWTTLAGQPEEYVHMLRESGRILKSFGILSISEKEDSLKKVRDILTGFSYLDFDSTQVMTKNAEPFRSYYSQLAFPNEDRVYCLELRKK